MKKLLILLCVVSLSLCTLQAKESKSKKGEVVTTTFVTDIDCEGCERKILNSIPFQKGVSGVEVDIPTKQVKVIYNSARSSEESLIEAFKRIGVVAKTPTAKGE